jgi:hypothetical protein
MSSHGKRICKNDSKPNLFFVTESGVLWIIDQMCWEEGKLH